MEIFAFTHNEVGYEDHEPAPQLRSFDDFTLELPKSVLMGAAGLAAATVVMAGAPAAQAIVYPGDVCPAVGQLQRALNARGFSAGAVDNVFGSQTRSALISFQRQQGLAQDGVAGPATADRLGLAGPGSPFEIGNGCGDDTDGGTGQERSGVVNTSSGLGVVVRSGAGTGFGSVGSLAQGTTVFYDPTTRTTANGYTWVRITQGTYRGRWVAENFLGSGGSGQERSGFVDTTSGLGLTVRSGPGTGFGSVGSVAEDARVFYDPTSRTNANGFTWVRVTQGAYQGRWVAENFLSSGGSGTDPSGRVSTNSGLGLTVRSGPGTGFGSVGSLAEGTIVFFDPTSATTSGGYTWVRVSAGSYANRWVARNFLR